MYTGDIDVELDACGLACPMPLLKMKQALNKMQPGQILKVLATDGGSQRDFNLFAQQAGHVILARSNENQVYTYFIKKAA